MAAATTTIIRTYELFEVKFDTATWSGYHTAAEAQAVVDALPHRNGVVVRKPFEVTIRPEHAHLYQPGVADRPA